MRIATSLARSLAGIALLAALAAGCSDDSATPRTGPADAAYAGFGAYPVGVTTLDLQDRQVEVWYPTDASRTAGRTKASYLAFEVLPPAIVAILPPDLNLEIGMDAYRDVAIRGDGPFPVFTFSHGAGGFRQAYSGFLTRLASHGLVVASIDHLEWGLLEQVGLRPADAIDRTPADVVLETLARLDDAGHDPSSVLHGGVDTTRVATAGHSAGGRAAFALPERPEIRAMIGYATGRSSDGVQNGKPILLLAGEEDDGAPALEESYDAVPPTRRFVSIGASGHNSFTDQCAIIHGGNDFLDKLVAAGFPLPESLLKPAKDGCLPRNLAPAAFWDVVTHFTVAHVRAAFGIDETPVGLGDGVAEAFDDVTLRYRHDP